MFIRLRRVPARTRTRSGACTSDTYMRIAPTLTSADVNTSPDAWAALGLELATTARRAPTRDYVNRHPCRQAAFFLSCASRPPDACILRFARPRLDYGPNSRRAYVNHPRLHRHHGPPSPGRRRRNHGGRRNCRRCNIRRFVPPWPTADPVGTTAPTFANILQSNYVSPHQIILDTDIDHLATTAIPFTGFFIDASCKFTV